VTRIVQVSIEAYRSIMLVADTDCCIGNKRISSSDCVIGTRLKAELGRIARCHFLLLNKALFWLLSD
jgi:hypothetical protein